MTGKRLLLLALAVLIVFGAACKPKPPDTPAILDTTQTEVTPLEPEDVTPPPDPPATDDIEEEEIPADLADATEWAHERGLLGVVYFPFDSSTLDSQATDRLTKNAAFLRDYPEYVVTVEGHCDERGTNEYNIALGDRRSDSARDFVSSQGIAGGRLRTVSLGEERPVCEDSGESCWRRNRRAYFKLTGKR